jgi:hypothetical protein
MTSNAARPFVLSSGCVLVLLGASSCSEEAAEPNPVTHSIVKPTDLAWVTQFNSCCHVEYPSGSGSSHKHYLEPTAALAGQNNAIEMYAPCDGTITTNKDRLTGCSNGDIRGSDIYIRCAANDAASVVLFHIDLLPGVDVGSELVAGELIGHAALACAGQTKTDFDFTYYPNGESAPADTIFHYMSADAIAPWTARGITDTNVEAAPMGACTDYSDTVCFTQRIVF